MFRTRVSAKISKRESSSWELQRWCEVTDTKDGGSGALQSEVESTHSSVLPTEEINEGSLYEVLCVMIE